MSYQILAQHIEPRREERRLPAPPWTLDSPTTPIILSIAPHGELYRHQSIGLQRLAAKSNLVLSTGTASGKTLVFQVATLDILAKNPTATAMAIYPIKALSRDQLARWRHTAPMAGLDPATINKIDGDVPMQERTALLQQSRIAAMTPDIVHAWLLRYSDDNPATQHISQLKKACRDFISNLAVVIIDEAHVYETSFGANMAYLLRRLRAKKQQLNPRDKEPLFIAASATIKDPVEHLEDLTGLPFTGVTEEDNGSPKSPLTIQHIPGRTTGHASETDMADLIREIVKEHQDGSYIAFADDRQKVERIARDIEPTGLIHEEDIITGSTTSMSYRSGLQARELIEKKLKEGSIRGVVSTSALEMGIDIPELSVGINLGRPNTVKRTKQRAGRVGRRTPGRFIILDEPHAFQFDEGGLRGYWEREPEPANLYLDNRPIQVRQAACLYNEQNSPDTSKNHNWPEGFEDAITMASQAGPYAPDTREVRGTASKRPHDYDMRSIDDKNISAYIRGRPNPLADMTKVEAMKELYTWATYHHAKQSYVVTQWNEDGTDDHPKPHVILALNQDPYRRTNRIIETRAEIDLNNTQKLRSTTVTLGYASSASAKGIEAITGVNRLIYNEGKTQVEPYLYADHKKPDITRESNTNMTFLIIQEEWFTSEDIREMVANALRSIMCHMDNVAPEEIMTAHTNVRTTSDGAETSPPAIAIWDRATGGLGLTRVLYDKIRSYADRLAAIALDPTRADDHELPLPITTARNLQRALQTLPEITHYAKTPVAPKPTVYAGTAFRSKLEARWACHMTNLNIPWDYEPAHFGNWVPDLALKINSQTVYAEIKPVNDFPIDVADKIDNSDWQGPALILGNTPESAWKRDNGNWQATTLDIELQS